MLVANFCRARVVGRAQHADESTAEVAEEIAAVICGWEPEDLRPVERGADDGAMGAGVLIGVDGIAHAADAGRLLFLPFAAIHSSLRGTPRFTSSQESWPTSLTCIRPLVESTAKVKGLRRPNTQMARVDALVCRVEGVVRGNRAIGVDAQQFAQRCVQRLRVGGHGILAHGHVQLAVVSEMNGATVVILPRPARADPGSAVRCRPVPRRVVKSAVKRLTRLCMGAAAVV